MLWIANRNPAFIPFRELFDDRKLKRLTAYNEIIKSLKDYFNRLPGFGPDNQKLVKLLQSPAKVKPDSLEGQLMYIRDRWGYLLSHYLIKLMESLDAIVEEKGIAELEQQGLSIPLSDQCEPKRYSPDRDWMPNLVMIAKNTHVWMSQLSRQFHRKITRLDQIPDEILDQLAEWGFTGLWLIGLWERSKASARIKQLCGNPDAIASAYSLADYHIAEDLGGEEAFQNLRDRAWQRGIRLASDMVPNHMGIDSHWVTDHPDWFINLTSNPYPSYSFNGPDLSPDPKCVIQLEDHYFNHTDAAVVFKYHDRRKKRDLYIYHGNDGTGMPWNDTAQLNYLLPEVREAVIQTILQVARRSPIIRFDAAMTLTRRHYQRLWFPEPGAIDSVPTRKEFGMSKDQFSQAMPNEFWCEVVDRVSREYPDTLLLAEAFWLMEGYFVRSLGMHRVYNSAFMHMLRDEDNAKYHQVMKDTMEFDPEVLRRFVNFMNNPDERTAIDQFGNEDKYFGVCILMCTMPGLPMFGHGQVEGFTEKYGMEFYRPLINERPDVNLIKRHEKFIFPLLKKRKLFTGIENFAMYDFQTKSRRVNQNVFAFSNRTADESVLVIYNNKRRGTNGWLKMSTGIVDQQTGMIHQRSLLEALGLGLKKNSVFIFQDFLTGLEYIRTEEELMNKGLQIHLGPYQAYVMMDFHEIEDDADHTWFQVCRSLGSSGTKNLNSLRQRVIKELKR